ncbi:MAG: tRNA pseudouridine(55) synthase TruB [Pseudomonadota bacterium]
MVIDKPAGVTSAHVVARLKRSLGGMKTGHTGTLDPFATGVMVCCINRATKLARFFLSGGKTYQATLCLGIETDTQDPTGRVTGTGDTENLSESVVLAAMARFTGDLLQAPPVFSALKHQGTPLYKLARSGHAVQKPPRPIHISVIEDIKMALPEVFFSVTCSAGTYIRTLCADIGRALGCGGHLKALRRIESCGFTISEAIGLDAVDDLVTSGNIWERIIPMGEALRHIPLYIADPGLSEHILQGRPLTKQDLRLEKGSCPKDFLKIVDTHHHLLAVLMAEGDDFKYGCVFPRLPANRLA